MITRTVMFFQGLSVSVMMAGALLLSGPTASTSRDAALGAAATSGVVADFDPSIYHRWD